MQLENILKVGDISSTRLQTETVSWLQDHGEVAYADNLLEEHIYNINSIIEDIDAEEIDCPNHVYDELKIISNKLQKKDCGYLRITF